MSLSRLLFRLRNPPAWTATENVNLLKESADCISVLREFLLAFEERKNAYLDGTNEPRISLSQKRFREAHDAALKLKE